MIGILWFLFWQALGVLLAYKYFAEKRLAVRLWLGSAAGTVLSMWAPIPFAFLMGFTRGAHLAGLGCGLIIAALTLRLHRETPFSPDTDEPRGDRPLMLLLPPFLALCVYLLCTHTLSPYDGGLYSGQCSYGDMCMHLGFITSMAEQGSFPFEYSILPGSRLCYPFLCDSVSASLYLLGLPLRAAYIVPMVFALAQVFCGGWFLGREIVRRRGAAVLAFILFFLNGGLGMVYFMGDYSLTELFTGFYTTPTNLTDRGIRWVNVIADMLLPQRATLFGWAALFAILYLLYRAVFRGDGRAWLPAGIFGGLLPMIHTHSYFALGLVALCWLLYSLRRDGLCMAWFRRWLLFGLPAVLLAAPQLMLWTLRSVEGNSHFLRIGLDWVNQGQENWLWFWLKNVGLVFAAVPFALIFCPREQRPVFSGAALIFVLGEIVLFQPNPYDNNKLFYVAYLFACFLTADFIMLLAEKLKTKPLRAVFLALVVVIGCNAAVFTLGREVVSGLPNHAYRLFSADDVSAAEYIMASTEPDAVFLTDDNHNNTVAALTGRNIVCGSPSYLYYHGLDYTGAQCDAQEMLTDAEAFERLRGEYSIGYVYFGSAERMLDGNIYGYLAENYPAVFESDTVTVFDVR